MGKRLVATVKTSNIPVISETAHETMRKMECIPGNGTRENYQGKAQAKQTVQQQDKAGTGCPYLE